MKESEALKKWCPLIKIANMPTEGGSSINVFRSGNLPKECLCKVSRCMMWEAWTGEWEVNPKFKDDPLNEKPNIFIKSDKHGDCGLKSKGLECNLL